MGASADPLTKGWAHLLRNDYPDNVLIAAGSSTTAVQWATRMEPMMRIVPRSVIVCLGTNHRFQGVSLADCQAAMASIVMAIQSFNLIPVVLSAPPVLSPVVPRFEVQTLNTWLTKQGWRYVDIYSLLVGSGTALNPSYDSGDGVHWNNAGHAVVYQAVASYLKTAGL